MVVIALAGCADKKKQDSPSSPPPSAAKPAPPTACDADPDFIHVDRDQLAALCIESEIPPTYWAPTHGALQLADGQRVPWLGIQLDERVRDPAGKDWIARTREALHDMISLHDGPVPPEGKRTGSHWYNMPCSRMEAFTTVVTVVALDKKGNAHVYAIRGDKMLDQDLGKAEGDAPFRTAFELTEKLVGKAKIANHNLAGSTLSTVDYEAWQKAAKP